MDNLSEREAGIVEREDLALLLRQARYVLRDLHHKHSDCGYMKMATGCELAADMILEDERAAAHIEAQAEDLARIRGALVIADAAIAEMFRYFDGGETRGSYDGKPERNQLRKAGYVTRAALGAKP